MKRYVLKDRRAEADQREKRNYAKKLKYQGRRILAVGMVMWIAADGLSGAGSSIRMVWAEETSNEISMRSYISRQTVETATQITIQTAEELQLFTEYVDQGGDTAGKTFCLKDDIVWSSLSFQYDPQVERTGIYRDGDCLAAVDKQGNCYKTLEDKNTVPVEECVEKQSIWKPIGTEEHPFQGSFQMNGHTIRGIAAIGDEPIKGLFGVIDQGGTVSGGSVEAALIIGGTAAGSIAGINNGTVMDSSCTGSIVMSNGCAGGVIGTNTSVIEQVTAQNVIVDGKSSTMTTERDNMERVDGDGGIAGFQLAGTISNCVLKGDSSCIVNGGGGIFGYMAGGSVENCSNHSDLTSLGANIGGIGGFIFQGQIISCVNYGNISYTYQYDEHVNMGGIAAGSYAGSYGDILITDCINEGDVWQTEREGSREGFTMDSVGGIIGRMGGGVLGNCGNRGTVGISTDKEDSKGARIGGARGFLQVGGIAAGCDGASMIRNCYNIGDIYGDIAYTGGIAGRKNFLELRACYTAGKISQKLGYGQITGFVDGGDIVDCFYLAEDNASSYSTASESDFQIIGGGAVSRKDIEEELAERLNLCAASYGSDYFQKRCPLRKWCQGTEKYPVLSEEYVVISQGNETPTPDQTPLSSGQPDSSAPDTSVQPDAGAATWTPEKTPEVQTSDISETASPSTDKKQLAQLKKKTSLSLLESSQIAKVKKITVNSEKDGSFRLIWNASEKDLCYGIYRQDGVKSNYKKLAVVAGKTTWLDKSIQKGRKYRYQIFACRQREDTLIRSGVTESKWIEAAHFRAPNVIYQTEIIDGRHYMKLTVSKYQGDHIDIVMRKNGKEQVIRLHPISKYHGVFRFSYTKTGKTMYCKVRTWKKKSGKKRFSEYTDLKKIML